MKVYDSEGVRELRKEAVPPPPKPKTEHFVIPILCVAITLGLLLAYALLNYLLEDNFAKPGEPLSLKGVEVTLEEIDYSEPNSNGIVTYWVSGRFANSGKEPRHFNDIKVYLGDFSRTFGPIESSQKSKPKTVNPNLSIGYIFGFKVGENSFITQVKFIDEKTGDEGFILLEKSRKPTESKNIEDQS